MSAKRNQESDCLAQNTGKNTTQNNTTNGSKGNKGGKTQGQQGRAHSDNVTDCR